MTRIFHLFALALFVLLSLFLIWFGVTYATVKDVLFFHAAAVPDASLEAVKPIYFALMRLIGAASAFLGVLGAYTALVPVRRGVPYAATVLAISYIGVFMAAAFTAEKLAETGAPTSWHLMGVLIGVTAAAYGCRVLARRTETA